MCKKNILTCMLFFILLGSAKIMYAQQKSEMNYEQLTPAQKGIVKIAALTATGNLSGLKVEFVNALDNGLNVAEIKEILTHLYAYCGFPRSLNAINILMEVLKERKASGIQDKEGKTDHVNGVSGDRYERGRKVLEKLTGTAQSKPAPGFGVFAPRIDAFLKEHLFADIFDSDILTYQQRELATISALSSMQGTESQLKSHLSMGTSTGITLNQLAEVAPLIEESVNRTQANVLRRLISKPEIPILDKGLMVRISEIEIHPEQLEKYKNILKEESAASVEKEPGVLAIFPMYQKAQPNQVRIIEIYANEAAYKSHLQTPHFQLYKTSTANMVKSLKLVDMTDVNTEMMPDIFKKIK